MVGNKWFKTDLHLHSPESVCFKKRNEVTAEMWVQKCLDEGLECVALTDHNSGNNVDEYKSVANQKGLVFFPGVEITCGENGTHLLVIFDLEDTTETVNDFLVGLGIKRESFGNSKPGTSMSVIEVINRAVEQNKIVIPAHIDEFNGLANLDNQVQNEILNHKEIFAVQLVQNEFFEVSKEKKNIKKDEQQQIISKISERYDGADEVNKWFKISQKVYKRNDLSILTFSDNPDGPRESKHGLWGIGTRFSHIKMTEKPTLNSLKDALRLGQRRVKHDFGVKSFENENKNTFLKKLIIKNTTQNQIELIIDFSEDLTTIIGGRGTGKSFITRFLAYVLNKEEKINQFEEVKADYNNFAKLSDNRSGVLQKDTEVQLYVQHAGDNYCISRTFTSTTVQLEEHIGSEKFEPEERLKQIAENIDIYLQKQIFEMSKNQTSIRDFIDVYCEEEISVVKGKINELENQIRKLSLENKSMSTEISKESKLELEHNDLENKLKKLSDPKIQDIVRDSKESIKEENILENDYNNISNQITHLKDYILNLNLEFSEEFPQAIRNERVELQNALKEQLENIVCALTTMEEAKDRFYEDKEKSEWSIISKQRKVALEELKNSLTDEEIKQLEDLNSLSNQIESTQQKLENIRQLKENTANNKSKEKEYFKEIIEQYGIICKIRRNFLKDKFDNIKVSVQEKSDFESYVTKLRKLIGKENVYDDQFDRVKEKLENKSIDSSDIFSVFENIDNNESLEIFTDKRLLSLFKNLSTDTILDIKFLIPQDKIIIRIGVNGRTVELTNASAGQKTSAMLTMILGLGNKVLVLDQPEDDLDSQLINDLIVSNIINKKENRQIIAVTHNANIPVNADSEWIIAMGDTKELTVGETGSIDQINIKDKICLIMEGGSEAFKNRAIRYGFK